MPETNFQPEILQATDKKCFLAENSRKSFMVFCFRLKDIKVMP